MPSFLGYFWSTPLHLLILYAVSEACMRMGAPVTTTTSRATTPRTTTPLTTTSTTATEATTTATTTTMTTAPGISCTSCAETLAIIPGDLEDAKQGIGVFAYNKHADGCKTASLTCTGDGFTGSFFLDFVEQRMNPKNDLAILSAFVGGSILGYKILKLILYRHRKSTEEWIPIGRIKELYLFPVKSGKAVSVFSMKCDFLCVSLESIRGRAKIVQATLFNNQRQDGYDCGDEAAEFFTKVVEEHDNWWNNNVVPKREDDFPFSDATPYMITTQASLDDLNERLEKQVTNVRFRPNIVVEGCPAWDEDKWDRLRFGARPDSDAAEMECYRSCDRCSMTKIDPEIGQKAAEEPFKTLQSFRLPTDNMAKSIGKAPIFGVHTGMNRSGFLHVGQVVWAVYKPNGAF
ncbi:unnamed protein product, partial [Mesorhabditis spiculigera]